MYGLKKMDNEGKHRDVAYDPFLYVLEYQMV
jgi:hypothetical protein